MLGGDMKRIFAIFMVIALVLTLGMMINLMEGLGVSLISDKSPAISIGGGEE